MQKERYFGVVRSEIEIEEMVLDHWTILWVMVPFGCAFHPRAKS